MTQERNRLITAVFTWEKVATQRGDIPLRRDLWHLIDTLYADLSIFRTPGQLQRAETVLNKIRQTEDVIAIKRELGLYSQGELVTEDK